MTRVILDPTALAKLRQAGEGVEVCDEAGRTQGYFTPVTDRSLYEGLQIPFTEEELQRRERQEGGRTLKEILADLEQRA
jgi:hypothetical protein